METKKFNVEDTDLTPVREMRIVRLNEIRQVKASSITPKFRPTLKVVKYISQRIVENWDGLQVLGNLFIDDATRADIEKTSWKDMLDILNSRIEELKKADHDKYLKTQYEMAFVRHGKIDEAEKTVLYSHNDIQDDHIVLIAEYLKKGFEVTISSWCTGRTRCEMVTDGTLAGVKKILGEENLEISENFMGYVVRVKKEELPDCVRVDEKAKVVTFSDNCSCSDKTGTLLCNYLLKGYRVRVTSNVEGRTLCNMVVNDTLAFIKNIFGEQNLNIKDEALGGYAAYLVAIKPSEPKKENRGRKKITRNVGDIHPNGKWIWIEYQPGKFDWKSLKGKYGKKEN